MAGVIAAAALLILTAGCKGPGSFSTGSGNASPITPADITYPELATRYNQAVEPLGTLWARTDVVVAWYEENGEGERRFRRERGEGKLIFRRPGDTALLVEKLGKTYLWAGSDADRYWLFDMVDGDNKTAYIGSFDKLGEPGVRGFPFPVRPDVVPLLLGLTQLPVAPEAEDSQPEVEMFEGQYLVELRDSRLRMLIDPETFRPSRVDLLDDYGFSALTAKLEGQFDVETPSLRKSSWPVICERAEVFVSGYDSKLTVAMDTATADPNRVRGPMFDFDKLSQALKPGQVIPLDPE